MQKIKVELHILEEDQEASYRIVAQHNETYAQRYVECFVLENVCNGLSVDLCERLRERLRVSFTHLKHGWTQQHPPSATTAGAI